MHLNEAIQHLSDSLSDPTHEWGCEECKTEHEQLLEWLEEFKRIRDYFTIPNANVLEYNAIYSALTGDTSQDDKFVYHGEMQKCYEAQKMNDALMLRKAIMTLQEAVSKIHKLEMENAELRRMLRLAVEDLDKSIKACENDMLCEICSYEAECNCVNYCYVDKNLRSWKHHDESMDLLGGTENAEN